MMSEKRKKQVVDYLVSHIISRKFLAWIVATVLVILGVLTSEVWGTITIVYIGSQSVLDAATQFKFGWRKELPVRNPSNDYVEVDEKPDNDEKDDA